MNRCPNPETLNENSKLKMDKIRLECQLESEKKCRIYYQDIVYEVCNILDLWLDRSVRKCNAIVCGTEASPSDEVQQTLCDILNGAKRWRWEIFQDMKRNKEEEEARPALKSAPKETEEAQKHLTTEQAQNLQS